MEIICIRYTSNIGKGLFANTKFVKNQVLFAVEGEMKVDSYGPNYHIGARWLGIDDRTWLSPSRNNYWRYINHSCVPNSGLKDKVMVVAMRNIEKDEEITIDYSITEADPYWRMKCKCSKQNCRKIIRSIQSLPEEIYQKYKPFVPEFLRRVRNSMCIKT